MGGEDRVTGAWLRRRLGACGSEGEKVTFSLAPLAAGVAGRLAVRFDYAESSRYFRWSGDLATGQALFEADFGGGRTSLSAAVSLLAPEIALSEAMFF